MFIGGVGVVGVVIMFVGIIVSSSQSMKISSEVSFFKIDWGGKVFSTLSVTSLSGFFDLVLGYEKRMQRHHSSPFIMIDRPSPRIPYKTE